MKPQTAFKYEVRVQEGGKVELNVPLSQGTWIAVFVVEEPEDDFRDLVACSVINARNRFALCAPS